MRCLCLILMLLCPALWAAEPPAPVECTGGYQDFQEAYVQITGLPAGANEAVHVREGNREMASATTPFGGPLRITLPFPPVGQQYGQLAIRLGDKEIATVAMPDLAKLRREAFESGGDPVRIRWWVPEYTLPRCRPEVFAGKTFPAANYPDPARMRNIVGQWTIQARYFDANFAEVQRPTGDGRYGAVITVAAADGQSLTTYQTLCRTSEVRPGESALDTLARLQHLEYPRKADQDWWHLLRKKIGLAISYPYFVRLPRDYDVDQGKRWPVIIYLHGSGGADKPEIMQRDGIQSRALRRPDFPFIAVSLQSSGGWFPPAVRDAVDEVETKYRVDRARIYLTGFSMGGMGAWMAALDQPDRYAALAVVGGKQGDPACAARLKNLPVWVFNGANDTITRPEDALKMVQALRDGGADVKWTEVPNADHLQSCQQIYLWPDIYDWFLTRRR